MDLNQMFALKNMLMTEQEQDEDEQGQQAHIHQGSVFGPGDIGGKEKKEIAKPFAKIQVKNNTQ